ncbi:MAG TPA: amino acid ABC transporter permease [Actinomycetota bacterium]|nr:amino acid ABC transporter permease [Actinomycetota bacterium]
MARTSVREMRVLAAEERGLVALGRATLSAGAASVALVLGGTLGVVVAHVLATRRTDVYERIVAGLRADTTALLLVAGAALGATALVTGWWGYRRMPTKGSREAAISGALLGLQAVVYGGLLLAFRAGNPERFAFHFLNFDVLRGSFGQFLTGAKNTMLLATLGEAGGIAIGLMLSLLALSRRMVVRAPARAYINFFRGTPLIWQLSIFWFGIRIGLNLTITGFQAAVLVFAMNTGAYAAEVFRAGIQSIERGQLEAARGLGMSYFQAMWYAIIPQAVRRVIPPLMNEFVILIKDTALILVLGLTQSELDLYNVASQGYSASFNATFFVAAALGYLAVTLPLIRAVNVLERRLRSGLVGVAGA